MRLASRIFEVVTCIISIHAPLTGCDYTEDQIEQMHDISIHAPLTGCE